MALAKAKKYWSKLKTGWARLKTPAWRAMHSYPRYCDTLPLDPTLLLLESEHGASCKGIIFSILQHVATCPTYAHLSIDVAVTARVAPAVRRKLARYALTRVNVVIRDTTDYYRVVATAKYLINDTSFLPFFIKRPGQLYLNTWHGTPLKTLGKEVVGQENVIGNIQKNFIQADWVLMPNAFTDKMLRRDYMLDNLAQGKRLFCGYPRNTVFFDNEAQETALREQYNLTGKRVYAYLPTYRGTYKKGKTSRDDIALNYFLYEIDDRLTDDEVLYVNLHTFTRSSVDFRSFKHIKPFPGEVETYDFLSLADVLVTDYSSVFFDFACTRRKIVLFVYDHLRYLRDRGMYLSLDSLPFPQVLTVEALLTELRTPKGYDDSAFLEQFCPYEEKAVTEKLCRHVLLAQACLKEEPFPDNGKPNVLIYTGNLAPNGITTALFALLHHIDLTARNYILLASSEKTQRYAATFRRLPSGVSYITTHGKTAVTYRDRILTLLFKGRLLSTHRYLQLCGKRLAQNTTRCLGTARIDTIIHFSGYENEMTLWFATFPCPRFILVHNDMAHEIATRGNQRKDLLQEVYSSFERTVIVTTDLYKPTEGLLTKPRRLDLVRNFIDVETIRARARLPMAFDATTLSTHSLPQIEAMLADPSLVTIVSVGRFSPEKGHLRLLNAFQSISDKYPNARLFIIGGNAYQDWYTRTLNHTKELGLSERVVLTRQLSNPYPFIKACDGLILSSFYEGFGLVLVEGDILGLPVVSTDITGPRTFMQAHGGRLVENSEEGIRLGLELLLTKQVPPLSVDYDAYNQENREAFERLFVKPDASEATCSCARC